MTSKHHPPQTAQSARFERLARLPFQQVGGATAGTKASWKSIVDIFKHREMLNLMIRRDLKSKYKDSSLGFIWSLVRPLTQLFIYYVVLGHFLGAARGIPDFAIYIYSGLTIYGLFSEIILSGVASITTNTGLVKKIYLPREIFPLASIGSAFFNFTIQLSILLVATIAIGAFPAHLGILYAIPAILLVVIYGTAFALLLSAINVYFRDVQYLVEVATMLLMWASPIVYSLSMVGNLLPAWAMSIYTNNPLTLAVMGFQKAFWIAGDASNLPGNLLLRMAIAAVVGLFLTVVAHQIFRRLQGNFAQNL